MGWFNDFTNKYPFTNFHELNLSWFLDEFIKLQEEARKFYSDINKSIVETVNEWLTDHPEATTTVEDGSITENKINESLLKDIKNYYYTPEFYGAVGDGVTDDTQAFKDLLINNSANVPVLIPAKHYIINEPIISHKVKVHDNGIYDNFKPMYKTETVFDDTSNIGFMFNYKLNNTTSYAEACCYNSRNNTLVVGINDYTTSPAVTKFTIIELDTNTVMGSFTYPFSTVNAMSYNADANEIMVSCINTGNAQNTGCQLVDGTTYQWKGTLNAPDSHPYYFYNNDTKTYARVSLSNDIFTVKVYNPSTWEEIDTKYFPVKDAVQQDSEFIGSKLYQLTWTGLYCFDLVDVSIDSIETKSLMEMEGVTVHNNSGFMIGHMFNNNGNESVFTLNKNEIKSNTYNNFMEQIISVENYDLEKITAAGKYLVSVSSDVSLRTARDTYHFPDGCNYGILENIVSSTDDLDNIATVQKFTSLTGYHGLFPVFHREKIANIWYQWNSDNNGTCKWLRTGAGGNPTNAVKTVAESLPIGHYSFNMSDAEGGEELPADETKWQYASGEIFIRDSKLTTNNELVAKIVLYSATDDKIAVCTCWNGTWTAWTIK